MAPTVLSDLYHHTLRRVNKHFKFFVILNLLGEDKLILTKDITPLYTVVPNGKGLLVLKHFLCIVKEPSMKTLLRLALNP